MGGLIGFAMLIALPVLGFRGASWSWVFYIAIAGLVAYWMNRPMLFSRAEQESAAARSVGPIAKLLIVTYVAQVATCALLFSIGRGVGMLIGA
jgi:hypothetical protein